MLCFFSQQNLAKPNYLIQNLALMVQNTKTTGIRSMREISLCYISRRRQEALKNLLEEINHRKQIDQNIIEILRLSLKQTDVLDLLTSTRTTGQPVVDDWDCYKTLVKSFKNQCGAKMEYDMKYAGALANICNMGVDVKQSVAAIEEACAH
uniref:Legumain prodomain domain-containing protein n=1 Tax=Brassica oleracea var. oleracea TaxID=109376 RepID=A0A0D2ZV53_BRAOL